MGIASGERSDARANRARLIAAAHEVFAERGLDAEMKDIAERAGIGIGTIYRNFATKSELFAALATDLGEQVGARMEAEVDLADPAGSFARMVEIALETVEDYGALWQGMLAGVFAKDGTPRQREIEERAQALVRSVYERGRAIGQFREYEPAFAVAMIEAAAHGYHDVFLAIGGGRDQAKEFLLRAMLTDAGYAAASAPRKTDPET